MNNLLIKDYLNGKSLTQCSKDYLLPINKIKKILNDANIHIRNRSEQLIITNQSRGYAINHNYFSKLNAENVYYLGFLAADGTVRKNDNEIKIALSAIDIGWLEEFKNNLKSQHKISTNVNNKGYTNVGFRFSSKQIKEDLKKYSVVPNKTYIGITMKNIPDNLKWYFLKGYFDGAGSFSWNKNTFQGSFKICSYKQEILQEFKQLIESEYNIHVGIYSLVKPSGNILYSLEMSTIGSYVILNRFYTSMADSPCLQRKKDKFLDFCDYRIKNLDPRAKTTFRNKVESVCSTELEKTSCNHASILSKCDDERNLQNQDKKLD